MTVPEQVRRALPWLTIALLVLASSATSLGNGFAYDDRHIITDNPAVKNIGRWWELFGQPYWPAKATPSLYRPLTMLAFTIQWAAGGGTALIFHVVNVLLYLACCLAVLWLARLLLPPAAAWLVAALFAVHPVHVEAVGNVVGQAEISVALALTLATAIYVRARMRGVPSPGTAAGILALYLVACLIKEHGVVLPALLLAAEATVVRDSRPVRQRVASLRPFGLALVMVALGYLAVRGRIVAGFGGDVPHPVFVNLPVHYRWLTMLGVVREWVRLLVWPARLYADYSPQEIRVRTSVDADVLLGAVLIVAVLALAVAMRRRSPVVTFGVIWLVVTLAPVSNFLIPTGIILAERTLFLPSAGFLLVVGAAVPWLVDAAREARPALRAVGVAAVLFLLGAGAWRSAERQRDWKDNDAIFSSLLRDAPLNFKAHYAYGGMMFSKGDLRTGEREWRTAIALLPSWNGVYLALGDKYREQHLCEPAIDMYRKALAIDRGSAVARAGLSACLLEQGEFLAARHEARRGMAYGAAMGTFRYLNRVADSALAARAAAGPAPDDGARR